MQTEMWVRIKASVGVTLSTVAGLAFAAAMAAASPALAQATSGLPTPAVPAVPGGAARPITGWTHFCQRYASECAVDASAPATITLNPAVWQTINTINRRVNKALRAATDLDHWNLADRWDLAEDGIGDCEDFQLVKRKLLAEAGLSRRAMRMTVVIDEKGEGHAVLTLLTNRGDLILDNKTTAVLPWAQTGYTFVKRESQKAITWVSLGGVTSPVTTANR